MIHQSHPSVLQNKAPKATYVLYFQLLMTWPMHVFINSVNASSESSVNNVFFSMYVLSDYNQNQQEMFIDNFEMMMLTQC